MGNMKERVRNKRWSEKSRHRILKKRERENEAEAIFVDIIVDIF